MTRGRRALVSWSATVVGGALFAVSLSYLDVGELARHPRRIALALLLSLAASGAWHAVRTIAWRICFDTSERIPFAPLARVRLAAEAISFLTWSGVAGEPLKVMLLGGRVPTRSAASAIALDRVVFLIVTTLLVGIGSLVALMRLPLSRGWTRAFTAFSIVGLAVGAGAALALRGRGTYTIGALRWMDRRFGTRVASGALGRLVEDLGREFVALGRGRRRQLFVLSATTICAYALMCAEAWGVLRVAGVPISFVDAVTIETFSRVSSFAASFIPANLGALEATSLAAAAAVGASGGGAPLAIVRRLRGLFWAGAGLAIGTAFASPAGSRGSRRFHGFPG